MPMSYIEHDIADALIRLLKRKNYDEILIKEIIEESKVSRSTFYKHFKDKEDVVKAIIRLDFSEAHLMLGWSDNRTYKEVRTHQIVLAEYVEIDMQAFHANADFYAGLSTAPIFETFRSYLAELLTEYFIGRIKKDFCGTFISNRWEILVAGYMTNIATIYTDWLDDYYADKYERRVDLTLVENMQRLVEDLCPRGLEKVFVKEEDAKPF